MKFNSNDYYLNFSKSKAEGEHYIEKFQKIQRLTIKLQLSDREESVVDFCLRPPYIYSCKWTLAWYHIKLYEKSYKLVSKMWEGLYEPQKCKIFKVI